MVEAKYAAGENIKHTIFDNVDTAQARARALASACPNPPQTPPATTSTPRKRALAHCPGPLAAAARRLLFDQSADRGAPPASLLPCSCCARVLSSCQASVGGTYPAPPSTPRKRAHVGVATTATGACIAVRYHSCEDTVAMFCTIAALTQAHACLCES